ncbi:HAD-IA family hydrolase [Candidatus Woesearchaeota archaeon]|nr:HAD-IA family hydrolase [Candidatus Woesearchaeota archaeon]
MIKAVIFDIDNTLVDFLAMKERCLRPAVDAMCTAGLKRVPDEVLNSIYELYKKYGMEYKLIFQELLKSYGLHDDRILAQGIVAYRKARSVESYPKAQEVLYALRQQGYKLGVVTDAPSLKAWTRLVYMKFDRAFDVVVTFDDTKTTKPHPLPFQKAIAELGVKASECLMVGDSIEKDIAGAHALGMHACFARYGSTNPPMHSGAEFEINKLDELLDILSALKRG